MQAAPRPLAVLCVATALSLIAPSCIPDDIALPGLSARVDVKTDAEGVVHLVAVNDLDLSRVQGWVHARDRFFQMDLTRREASGDLAEVRGPAFLGGDIQNRVVGLRRAAERSAGALTPAETALLQAYADGVNAWLQANPLPPEYAALEITSARAWDIVDSLVIGKAISASLSLDVDIGITQTLQGFIAAGAAGGFDGATLFLEDVNRSAPIDPASTVPDATGTFPFVAARAKPEAALVAKLAAPAGAVQRRLEQSRLLAQTLNRRELEIGSNEWGVAGTHSESGLPMIANDPHLSLNIPSTFYEWHLVVENDPIEGPMNVNGVGFPGTAGVILGQNERVTWGATTNSLDVSDVFLDELHVLQPACFALSPPALACIRSEGAFQRVDIEFPVYRYNVIGDGVNNNTAVASGLPLEGTLIATVPFRSFGPVLSITNPGVFPGGGITSALVLQYTGFHATREVQTFRKWSRAHDLASFLDGLADFDVGSQNWAYADADGNLAYFTSAELPLRRDLEAGGVHGGVPPAFIRDGSGPANWVPDPTHSQGQSIPYAILPFAEMPQTVNPANGFFANANNDPAGTTLDNDPFNQGRPSNPSAIYYLAPGYANGLRAGRITRLIQQQLDGGERISLEDMQRFQANVEQLDAELLVPSLLEAFDAASAPGAPPELAGLAADPGVAEAVERLADWDFATPTGIPDGYDADDVKGERTPSVPEPEEERSVAATLYNVWRGQLVRNVVDARLAALGTPGVGSSQALAAVFQLLREAPFDGVGASGVDFFPTPATLALAEDRRDHALLDAMADTLALLASSAFAPAFANSTEQADYRWGKLHRITFDHPSNPAFSIPTQAGYLDVGPGLPGVARDGGYEVVNASGFSSRSNSVGGFTFGSGPVRRYVGEAGEPGAGSAVRGYNVMPGGPSGVPGDALYATQLGAWLTADYHKVEMKRSGPPGLALRAEVFVPAP